MNFYKQAALALDHLDTKQGSVKGSLSAAGLEGGAKDGKRVLALVIETLKYRPTLQSLSTSLNLLHTERKTFPASPPSGTPSSKNLLLVLLHDLLFSKDAKIQASDKWPPKAAVMRHGTRLKAELVKLQIKKGMRDKGLLEMEGGEVGSSIPRYARCNTNITTLPSLISRLTATTPPFTLLQAPSYPASPNSFFLDPHLPDVLLAFPTSTRFEKHPDYLNGGLILQDKASCFPAKVMMYDWKDDEGEVIDATAAPGNKTTYLSALMGNQGKLHAFERSHARFKTLQKMLDRAGCKNVTAVRGDFLETAPEDFKKVTRILLDPSCSGSGIVKRLDYLLEDGQGEDDSEKQERLDKLAAFQLSMIQHAMKFPNVQRIVYSTCSIHKEEDEEVVMQALASPEALEFRWNLAERKEVLESWPRRGRPEHMDQNSGLASGVIRCVAAEDHTNGFFVSCFVRAPEASSSGVESNDKKRKANSSLDQRPGKLQKSVSADLVFDGGDEDEEEAETTQIASSENVNVQLTKSKKKKKKKKAKKAKATTLTADIQRPRAYLA